MGDVWRCASSSILVCVPFFWKVCKFLGFLISEYLPDHEHGLHGPMLILMRDATSSIGGFLRTVFGAGAHS